MSRGGPRPGAGRPRRDDPPRFRTRAVADADVGALVEAYAERRGIPVAEAAGRLMAWGARLAGANLRRQNRPRIKQGARSGEDDPT